MRTRDIAWLAGLLEGEGSFGFYDNSPRIWIGTMRRLLSLGQKIHRKKPNALATQPCYVIGFSQAKEDPRCDWRLEKLGEPAAVRDRARRPYYLTSRSRSGPAPEGALT